MYFITPCDPSIFLIGVDGTQLYGIGEKNSKLCVYEKSLFDVGRWKEFVMIDINVVKCDCCETGIHVAAEVFSIIQFLVDGVKKKFIWIAARENEFTHIFSITIETKKVARYKMLPEIYPEVALLNLNLCCKCVAPNILYRNANLNCLSSFVIIPRQYQSQTGIFQINVSINKSGHCLLWKKNDSITINSIVSSNILVTEYSKILSINERSNDEDGRIQTISFNFEGGPMFSRLRYSNVWHEMSFRALEGYCLTRRNDGNKSILQLSYLQQFNRSLWFNNMEFFPFTIDANFPSLESTYFFVSYRFVNRELEPDTPTLGFPQWNLSAVVNFIVFQIPAGDIVVIPVRMLTLSESAYLTLTRIPQPSRLPIANISIYDYIFQQMRILFCRNELKEEEADVKQEDGGDVWMSLDFIKKTLGLSNDFDLIHL